MEKNFFTGSCAPQQVNGLTECILGQIVVLSQQKYASNVVEKCLSAATEQTKQNTLEILCERPPEYVFFCHCQKIFRTCLVTSIFLIFLLIFSISWLKRLCLDSFANYVVQKLIGSASDQQIEIMHNKLQPFFTEMRRRVCGRKIVDMLSDRMLSLHMQNIMLGPSPFQFQ